MEQSFTEIVTHLVFQLAVILFAAKIAGEICERYIKIPPVLGELAAGIIIGPYALGGVHLPQVGALFELVGATTESQVATSVVPVSPELWAVAQIASIILLFSAGLETDLKQFLKYAGPASAVAFGGVVLPFALGAGATVMFGFVDSFTSPEALFIGAVMTATSVGITARVLSELGQLGSAEGVTVLAAAVLDDVLGILVLTIVVGISEAGRVSPSDVVIVGVKAFGFWIVLTGAGILLSKHISRALGAFKTSGAVLAIALALAFLAAGLAETAGLAMIIGAYSIGLALSGTDIAKKIDEPLRAVYNALVPIFFVVMGMLVNVPAMLPVLVFGTVLTALAIIGKVLGCGLPSLATGFNKQGSWRIGIGMLPRGEVALIVAGIGLARGVIEQELFGVAIMMTIVTTVIAPILLVPAFRNGKPGRGGKRKLQLQASDDQTQ